MLISTILKELYALRGRTFLVVNVAPIGYYLAFLFEFPHKSSDIDTLGCLISYNKAVMDYNNMLKTALSQIRMAFPKASLVFVGVHAILLLELFQHPTSHGILHI